MNKNKKQVNEANQTATEQLCIPASQGASESQSHPGRGSGASGGSTENLSELGTGPQRPGPVQTDGRAVTHVALKALSVRQPWAWLIVQGYKDIENRTWITRFRGRFLIHAAKTIDKKGIERVRREFPHIQLPDKFETRGIIGEVEICDCVTKSDSPWFSGPFGFVLRHAQSLPFRPYKGRLNFFKVD